MGPRRKWAFDLNSESIPRETLPDPPGFDHGSITTDEGSKTSTQLSKETEMKQKRAMEIAYGPGRNIFMQGFMMYMSGSSINIWSMMVVGHAFYNPIKALLSIDEAFARYASADSEIDLTLPKLAFIGCNAAMLALALWKLNTMRLLPITAADWTSFLVDKVDVESSGVPLTL